MTKAVIVLAYPGVQPLDVVGPFDALAAANTHLDALAAKGRRSTGADYDIRLVASTTPPVRSNTGLCFATEPLPDPTARIDTVVIPGGPGAETARGSTEIVDWIRAVHQHARRVVSVCTGAFLLAQAGLLDGCRATTHWGSAARLATLYPAIDVDPDPIFVRSSEQIWTSAGVTAGIDLALALIEADHGTEAAQAVARGLVLPLRRPGGQTQYAAPVWMPRAERAPVRAVQQSIETEPGAAHSITLLARRAGMSPRHFSRIFTHEVGESPGLYVERIRTEAARRQLEETTDTVAVIAERCGFGSAETLRRVFGRRVGTSPDRYRRSFA
ncbi:Transcriptional regulator, AraC family OS=Tsukamurella paurometabola (strain ATCC 8368 / DSM/ CCUG 35730 / CIP 100753 / JCM 10117 / KCTC 9821 / NBRC 16120/ NCIMB 702349 / NCTC 13040) OX=521096 GN=Tpau_2502 PE=4 SV=1 [Tsukamurella paurometabola]|uniref:Transcriptional regulator, AraC family n=1 Tax=Tsukamurella paurometabola (strain ATCC 8368 / DSM 20162 / CCUG 35730 / CIP 100753 / JCM 10117 / KCTC 9821 / NBRC 16120 / NCIMB 702349 / NCTC 13040) TaxID=521096 RepID=D5URQ1_TSUPD|nr:GlxA family transcriptional regulator [Tsukamurella paurometabola]ADG79106.1 transcriptional regulator, AraC family [Tsukamurella paurometabola DSM 20162]SUP34100.1 Multiple antibiotic resistance protein marA [Tsukamurella paurometabola]